MSSLQIRCPCGQTLKVPSSAAGKTCRCPKCSRELKIQVARAAEPEALDLGSLPSSLPPASAPSPLAQQRPSARIPESRRRPTQRSQQNRQTLVLAVGGFMFLAVCSVVAIGIWAMVAGGGGEDDSRELAGAFEAITDSNAAPVTGTPTGRDAVSATQPGDAVASDTDAGATRADRMSPQASGVSGGMIGIANEFIALAAVPNTNDAIKLIDQELFNQRVRSPEGSYDAMDKVIKVEKLLNNFAKRSFESTPGNGALRHWRILGKTKFDGQEAVLVRYYSEVFPPKKWIRTDEMIGKLVPLVSVEEYWARTGKLEQLAPGTVGNFKNSVPQRPDANGLLFPRAGYVLLCFDQQEGQPRLSDLASGISRVRLSRASGELYLREWDVTVMGRFQKPDIPAEPTTISIFGELRHGDVNDARGFDSMADFRHYVDPNRKPGPIQELPVDQRKDRTYRLKDVGVHVRQGSPRLAERLTAFRDDFPDDLGADMVVISLAMVKQEFNVPNEIAASVVDSAKRLDRLFNDPFLLYVQWMVARSQGDRKTMNRLRTELLADGFETAELHRESLEQAIESGKGQDVLRALAALEQYWDPSGTLENPEPNKQVGQRWAYIKQQQEFAAADDADNSGRRPGMRGPFGRFPPGGPRGPGGPKGGGGPSGPGSGPPTAQDLSRNGSGANGPSQPGGPRFGGRFPGRPGPMTNPMAQASTGQRVQIEIESDKTFDINAFAKGLAGQLQLKTYSSSRQNNRGTIQILYSGDLDAVVDAIEFGEAEIADAEQRTIKVRVTQ